MKAVKAALQEKNADAETITAFEKGAQAFVKNTILANFKDYEFYTGESMNPDGMYALSRHPKTTMISRVLTINLQGCSPQLP
jgi:hypothetical protein